MVHSPIRMGDNWSNLLGRPSRDLSRIREATGMCKGLLFWMLLGGCAVAQEQVEVSHAREMRGAWVASVDNISWPSRMGLSPTQQQAELTHLVTKLQAANFNAIFFQVRPEGDALYRSKLEPWSRFLSGVQGQDPGYDPLEFLIEKAHERNLEVHAWLNPYRAQGLPRPTSAAVHPHLSVQSPELVYDYGKFRWMDPASPEVRQRLVDVCRDLARRYDLDGLHFDDYFYPYPEADQDFPDYVTWTQYLADGGILSRSEWRRQHVNHAIEQVARAVRQEKSHLRFGISPFGIPAPDKPSQIAGFDQYDKLYADPQRWMDEGWVDYLAPQLYWPTTRRAQAFEPLLQWWAERARDGRSIFSGLNLAALGTRPEWDLPEYRKQIELTRSFPQSHGVICWSVNPLLKDNPELSQLLREICPTPVLTPPIARFAGLRVAAPTIRREGHRLHLSHSDPSALRGWTVYARVQESWELQQILPASQPDLELPEGEWAIAAATRHGVESLATVVP